MDLLWTWRPTPREVASWSSPNPLAVGPGGPLLSFKVALDGTRPLPPLSVVAESWSDIPWERPAEQETAAVAWGSRGNWRGTPFAELLLRPVQPSKVPGRARCLASVTLKLGGEQTEALRLLTTEGSPRGPFLNPWDAGIAAAVRRPEAAPETSTLPRPQGLTTPLARLNVSRDGIVRLTAANLASNGLDFSQAYPGNLHLFCRGREIPILVEGGQDGRFDPQDAVVFYGQKCSIRDRDVWNGGDFTDTNVYWLYADGLPGLRMSAVDAAPTRGYPLAPSFACTLNFEVNNWFDWADHFRPNRDLWYWGPGLWYAPGSTATQTVSLALPDPAPGAACSLQVTVAGFNPVTHQLHGALNGSPPTAGADPGTYSGHALGTLSWSFDGALSPTGNNTFELSIPPTQSVSDYQILDKVTVTYQRQTVAAQGALLLTDDDVNRGYQVSGFPAAPYAFLLGEPDPATGLYSPSVLTGAAFGSGTATFELSAAGGASRSVALASTTSPPDSVAACTSRDLSDPSLGCDLLVITHPALHPQGQDAAWEDYLARRRATMDVTAVDIQEVYDNYSFGLLDPTAIQSFLQDAAARWTKVPRYVLLLGDATYDYKNYLNTPGFQNLVPTMMVEDTSDYVYMGFYATDAWYADVNGDGFPDMAVGRIPAASYADLAGVLQKLAVYESQDGSGEWAKSAFYVADTYRQPWEQEFELFNTQLQNTMTVPPWVNGHLYFHDPPYNGTDYDAAAAAVRPWFTQCGIMHYDGHSGMTFWGYHDGILSANPVRGSSSDVDLLPAFDPSGDSAPLPFVVNSSCYNSGVQWSYRSLMEDLFLRPDRGSVGSLGYSGLAYSEEEEVATLGLFTSAFGWEKERTEGDLAEMARIALPAANARAVFSNILLGDPSMRLKLPAPLPPATLEAVPADATVFLSWPSPPSPVDHFALYRSADGGQSWTVLAEPGARDLAFTDSSVQNGATYAYVLKAWDSSGFEGPPTPEATATPDAGLCAIRCQASAPSVIPVGQPAAFHGEAQATSCLGPPDYVWNFGDGAQASTADALHAFASPGLYTWGLTVSREGTACARSGQIRAVIPPAVSSVRKLQDPFRIKMEGTGFHADATVFVNGAPWSKVQVKSELKVVLKGGASLKAAFPASTFVPIRIVNGDGGEVALLYDRTSNTWRPGS